MKHRWPNSIHSQLEAIFHSIRSFRLPKEKDGRGLRSFGSWETYRYEIHRFVYELEDHGVKNILDINLIEKHIGQYLESKLRYYVERRRSRQTFETILSAFGKFEYALNNYITNHDMSVQVMNISNIRKHFYKKSKKLLSITSSPFDNRAYPDPIQLIKAINNYAYQLQALVQYEGGVRAEGSGSPSNKLKNPITMKSLLGIVEDPITKTQVGMILTREKGGKSTEHYVSLGTYERLVKYITLNTKLETDYSAYLEAVNNAAKLTMQYDKGKGTHGLKHNFAQERYLQCVEHGLTHEQSMQQVSIETSHFRLNETLTYTRGR